MTLTKREAKEYKGRILTFERLRNEAIYNKKEADKMELNGREAEIQLLLEKAGFTLDWTIEGEWGTPDCKIDLAIHNGTLTI